MYIDGNTYKTNLKPMILGPAQNSNQVSIKLSPLEKKKWGKRKMLDNVIKRMQCLQKLG